MKIRIKLSLITLAIVAVFVAGISGILLWRTSSVSVNLSLQSIRYLVSQQAEYWKGREDAYIRVLRTLANIMAGYESVPISERRDRYDEMLRSALDAEPNMVGIYTVWKPNAIDNMDDFFINRVGSSPTGQYAIEFSRETGELIVRTSTDIEKTIAHISGPNARKDRVDNPVSRRVNGKDTFAFIMLVPITNPRTNEVVGGVGCLLTVDVMQEQIGNLIDTKDEVIGASIYSGDGTIIGDIYTEKIGRNTLDVDVEFGEYQQQLYQAIINAKPFEHRLYDPEMRTNVVLIMQPFRIGNSDQYWSILIGSPESYFMKEIHNIVIFAVMMAGVALFVSALIVYIVLYRITKPIVKVAETLKDISQGEGDLTRNIKVNSKDEVGELALHFNQTLDKIKHLVINIKTQTTSLYGISANLASNMNETASAINQVTANIYSIKGRVANQSTTVNEANAAMEQVVSNINKLNLLVEKQSENVSKASSAVEEMVANIQSVTQTLIKNSSNVITLRKASEKGRTRLKEVADDIQEIVRESEGLLEINAVMENIASQTNLLSMNAAIEASHAGESGKGFAVVAGEIRKLAESSSKQSKTIYDVLKKIRGSIEKITRSTKSVLKEFEAIDSSVKTVAEQEDNIRASMEEQGSGSKQILDSIIGVKEITNQVKSSSQEMLNGTKEVIKDSNNLEKITEEITGGMNEMASGAEQINIAVEHVNDISVKNREGIDFLIKEVSRFKVE